MAAAAPVVGRIVGEQGGMPSQADLQDIASRFSVQLAASGASSDKIALLNAALPFIVELSSAIARRNGLLLAGSETEALPRL